MNVPIRFLTCEPNLKGIDNYEDEADTFFKDPLKWIEGEYTLPSGKGHFALTFLSIF